MNITVIEARRDGLRTAYDKLTVELQAQHDEILEADAERLQVLAVERIQLDARSAATATALEQAEKQLTDARKQLDTPEYKRLKKQTAAAGQAFAEAAEAARDAMQAAYTALQAAQERHVEYKTLVRQDIAISPEQQSATTRNADAKSIERINVHLAPYMDELKTAAGVRLYIQGVHKHTRNYQAV